MNKKNNIIGIGYFYVFFFFFWSLPAVQTINFLFREPPLLVMDWVTFEASLILLTLWRNAVTGMRKWRPRALCLSR